MFERSDFCVINKIDLLPYVPFDMAGAVAYAREVNPDLRFFFTSALTEEGMGDWYEFLRVLAQVEGAIRA
jgi:hydrogenase nickel incorporation protein HypB